MLKKFLIIFAGLAAAAAFAQEPTYEGVCFNGQVAAKQVGMKGPAKILLLRMGGVMPVLCDKDDKIVIDNVSGFKVTAQEGAMFTAVARVEHKDGVRRVYLSTFQEKASPRTLPGKTT